MNFRDMFLHFKEMRTYFIFAFISFIFGITTGWMNASDYAAFLEQQLQSFRDLNSFIEEKKNPQFWLFLIIWLNNLSKGIVIIFLGMAFGVIPLIMLYTNGLILGYVLSIQPNEELWSTLFKGIIPHGIIEITAVLIACAYGMKLGVVVIQLIVQKISSSQNQSATEEWKKIFRVMKPLLILLALCFTIAAIIESTVTMWLLS